MSCCFPFHLSFNLMLSNDYDIWKATQAPKCLIIIVKSLKTKIVNLFFTVDSKIIDTPFGSGQCCKTDRQADRERGWGGRGRKSVIKVIKLLIVYLCVVHALKYALQFHIAVYNFGSKTERKKRIQLKKKKMLSNENLWRLSTKLSAVDLDANIGPGETWRNRKSSYT